jgi:hypothetical protein
LQSSQVVGLPCASNYNQINFEIESQQIKIKIRIDIELDIKIKNTFSIFCLVVITWLAATWLKTQCVSRKCKTIMCQLLRQNNKTVHSRIELLAPGSGATFCNECEVSNDAIVRPCLTSVLRFILRPMGCSMEGRVLALDGLVRPSAGWARVSLSIFKSQKKTIYIYIYIT